MIIIDTNVISETIKIGRDPSVMHWLNAQVRETLYFTAPALSELRLGIELLPAGKRKNLINTEMTAIIINTFSTRILPFDREAAVAYGALLAKAQIAGRTISVTDGQIAAIAHVNGFIVATRDTVPFKALGIPFINPWK